MENKKRLIDANALLGELDKFVNPIPNKSGYDFLCGVATVITEIEDAPTVDAYELLRGKWSAQNGEASCSNCGFVTFDWASWTFKYCPNCGSKMDGEGNARKDD